MVHFVRGAILRPSGVKLHQNCKQSSKRQSCIQRKECFISFLPSGGSSDHQRDYFQPPKPESENIPPTRKATDSTKKKLSGEVTIKEMRRFSKPKKFTTRDVATWVRQKVCSRRRRPRGPNHSQRPQTQQRREQRASKRCHLKPWLHTSSPLDPHFFYTRWWF